MLYIWFPPQLLLTLRPFSLLLLQSVCVHYWQWQSMCSRNSSFFKYYFISRLMVNDWNVRDFGTVFWDGIVAPLKIVMNREKGQSLDYLCCAHVKIVWLAAYTRVMIPQCMKTQSVRQMTVSISVLIFSKTKLWALTTPLPQVGGKNNTNCAIFINGEQ